MRFFNNKKKVRETKYIYIYIFALGGGGGGGEAKIFLTITTIHGYVSVEIFNWVCIIPTPKLVFVQSDSIKNLITDQQVMSHVHESLLEVYSDKHPDHSAIPFLPCMAQW